MLFTIKITLIEGTKIAKCLNVNVFIIKIFVQNGSKSNAIHWKLNVKNDIVRIEIYLIVLNVRIGWFSCNLEGCKNLEKMWKTKL